MIIEKIENPVWKNADHTAASAIVTFEGVASMPFLAHQNGNGVAGEVFAAIVAGDGGVVAPHIPEPFDPAPVKSECQRRIYAIASQNAQMNMTAYVVSGLASNADKTAFAHSLEWVAAMRAASAGLIEDEDVTFGSDSHWPACPADVAELASRF